MVFVHRKLVLDAICIIEGIKLVIKQCKICGKSFDTKDRGNNAKTCSKECSYKNGIQNRRQHYQDNIEERKQYSRQYYQDNTEKYKQYSRQYYQDNIEKYKQYNRQYYQDNIEERRQYSRQYYQDNIEERRQYKRQYYQDNIEKIQKYAARHRMQHPEMYNTYDKRLKETPGIEIAKHKCRERANYMCELTNSIGNHVHHLNSYNWDIDGRDDPNNMIFLSKQEHKHFHDLYGRGNNTIEQFLEFVLLYHADRLPWFVETFIEPQGGFEKVFNDYYT